MDEERCRDERRRKLVRARVRKHRELTLAAERRRSSDSSSSSDERDVRHHAAGIRAQNNLTPPDNQEGSKNSTSNEVLSSQNDDNPHLPIENRIQSERSNSPAPSGNEHENSGQDAEENEASIASSDWTGDEINEEDDQAVEEIDESADSEVSEEENENLADMDRLREWAIKNKIQQNHLDELLTICRRRWLPDLPKSSKTFLRTTAATYNIFSMDCASGTDGEFVYFGVGKDLRECIDPNVHTGNTIQLKFNVDGLPISKSDNTQLWPILCQVDHDEISYEPFVVALFCGMSKPVSNLVYFDEFCTEINQILEDGLEIEGHLYDYVTVRCFVCDTPARSFCKHTAGQNGTYSCERCTVKGTKRGFPATVYLSMDSEERTDESFQLLKILCEFLHSHLKIV
ncbi:uncharacterized protein LOC127286882 [Leptopilina boulardi]|uniref:uncharacterized protein LOC127286882 n=1 Tax=Leptopilina boulardi TaxID=63433 RepID=UPI0021F5FE2D|nr:uncharacterized protein LOC127286882 [Leptopilina boulardi]